MKTRNSETLADFVKYCKDHPEERFWQALRNWKKTAFIFIFEDDEDGEDGGGYVDTFYLEGK